MIKNISIAFMILISLSVSSQSIDFQYLEKDFDSRSYAKCLKRSEKAIDKGSNDPMPYFYKALSLYRLFNDDKTSDSYTDIYRECLSSLKTAKDISKNFDLFSANKKELNKLQSKVVAFAVKIYKKGLENESQAYLKKLREIFDDKDPVFMFNHYHDVNMMFLQGAQTKLDADDFVNASKGIAKIAEFSGDTAVNSYLPGVINLYRDKAMEMFKAGNDQLAEKSFDEFIRFNNKLSGNKPVRFKPKAQYEGWDEETISKANTAAEVDYLSLREKMVIYFINLARLEPKLFAETYLDNYVQGLFKSRNSIKLNGKSYTYQSVVKKEHYISTLYKKLKKMKPKAALKPDKFMYLYALCWAEEGGRVGAVGHNRRSCSKGNFAECCQYGHEDALMIVLDLLIDRDVPSLGHREILLDDYTLVGVSYQPHKKYDVNTVIDLF